MTNHRYQWSALSAGLTLAILCLNAPATLAQTREPIGRFVADARVALPRYKADPNIATSIGVGTLNLPTRGLGLVGGVHLYPLRMGVVTLGLGGEVLVSRASRALEPTTEGGEEGPTVRTQFSALSPQISLNFGSRRGWSYLSGGLGWSDLTTEREDDPVAEPESRAKTINYGGGARWFAKQHLAFSLDLRFYAISPQDATTGRPAYPRMTLMVFSGGVSFK